MKTDSENSAPWRKANRARSTSYWLVMVLLLPYGMCSAKAAAARVDAESSTPDQQTASANPMIHAQGTRIVDGNNREIILRGVLLEGWLMWNGTLWGAGLTSETTINTRLAQMAGQAYVDQFRTAIYDNFITELDIQMIAEMGFNTVRVPFNHTVLEDENPLEAYTAPGWGYLDRLLDWCEKHRVYVVLDLHSVPGGQTGLLVADPDPVLVWASPAKQQQTIDLWKAIATRYRNRQIVAGYDLMNEPAAPKGKDLVDLCRRIIAGIRTVDPDHMVLLEGNGIASTDFSAYKGPLDVNQAYSFHTYNFFTDGLGESNLRKYAKMAEAHNVPLWNGEIGAHKSTWVNGQVQLFENPQYHVCGWIFWPWKRVAEKGARDRYRHLMEIRVTSDWETVAGGISSWFGPSGDITPEIARRGMDDFINSSKAGNLVQDDEMKKVLNSHRAR